MATLGKTDNNTALTYTINADTKQASRYQASSSFTAKEMRAYINANFGTGEKCRLGIYADSSGSPGSLLGYTSEIDGDDTTRWKSAYLTSPVSIISGTYYWLAIIGDSSFGVYYFATGTAEGNNDTYSDGFADPFGSSTSGTREIVVFATDVITIGNGDLSLGGAILTTSADDKVAVYINSNVIYVDKDVDGTPTNVDSDTAATAFGGSNFAWIHAAIDGNDDIHIIASCDAEQTRDVAYVICDLTTGYGTWEEAANYTEQAPTTPGCAISLDSSDKPHVLFVDNVKVAGSAQDNVYYIEKTGASWAGLTQIGLRDVKTDSYNSPTITLRNSDYIEAFYYFVTGGDAAYNTYTGSWLGESVYLTGSAAIGFGGVISTTGGTVYRLSTNTTATQLIEENGVSIGYTADATYPRVSASLVSSDRYVFYIDSTDDVHLVRNDGSWNDEGDLQIGTFTYVIAEWAYNNENQSGEINYIFDDGTNVYYDSFSLAAGDEYFQSADGVLTPVGTIIKSGRKVLAGVLTPVGIISKITSKTFTGSSTLVGTLIKQAQKLLTGATTPVGTLATSFLQLISIAGSLTPSGTLIKRAGKVIAGSLTASGVLIKSTSKSFTGSLTAAGTLVKQTAKSISGSVTTSGVVSTTKVTLLAISGVVTASGILIRQTSKSFVGSLTAVGTLLRATARSLIATGSMTPAGILATAKTVFESITGSLTPSGSLIKQAGKVLLGSLTPSGVLETAKTVLISLAGVLTPAGGLVRQTGKIVTGSLIATGSLVKRTAKSIIGSISAVGTLATQKISGGYFQDVGGILTMSGIVVKKTGKIFVGSLTAVGALVKQTRKILLGSITSSGVLTAAKTFLLSIGGALTPVGTLIRQTGKIVLGSLTPVGTLIRQTAKAFIGSVTAVGSLVKQAAISFIGSITAVGSLATQKIVSGYFQVVGGVLTMSGILTRQASKLFTGSLTAVGTLAKQAVKSFIGSITAVGSLVTQKKLFRIIDGVLTMSGILVKQTSIQTSGIVTMVGGITKRISKSIGGVLTSIGTLARQLLGLPTPYEQIFAIASENRVYSIAKEVRIYSIPG